MKQVRLPMEELMPLLQMQMDTAGFANLMVTGWSMQPMVFNRRDSVVIQPATGTEGAGDVILYQRENGRYVLHRILRKCRKGLVLCGDNQFFTERIARHQVLAVVTGFTRNGKKYQVTDKGYKTYVFWWVALHPVRWMYLVPRRILGKLKMAIQRKRRS